MPLPIIRSAADYRDQLLALSPRGVAWPRDPSSVFVAVVAGIGETVARLSARAGALIADAFPASAYELLGEWEASLGLPDPCAGTAPGLQQRRAAVVAKLVSRLGQSIQDIVLFADALGYTITIVEYRPARLGEMRMGDRMNGAEWAHVWAIRTTANTVTPFRLGASGMGERFQTWGDDVLECQLRDRAAADTILIFQYV